MSPEGFAAIPNWLVRDRNFSATDKIVYVVLASHTGRTGTWAISIPEIADEAGLSVATVKRARATLKVAGVISWDTPVDVMGKGKSIYRVHSSVQNSEATAQSEPPVQSEPSTRNAPSVQSEPLPQTPVQDEPSGRLSQSRRKKNPSLDLGSVGTSPSSVKSSSATQAPTTRPDIDRLCGLLADLIESNGSRRPAITKKWRDACRLLIDKDGISPDRIERAIRWSQDDEFWRTNVLSMPKLRDQFDRMRLEATRKNRAGDRTPTTAARVQAGLSLVEQLRAEEHHTAQLAIGGTA